MKLIKWRILIITCLICLLPILPGIAVWDSLPETVAVHFDINNNPDNFASKGFVVFGMPLLMVLLQIICCIINDANANKHGDSVKFEAITKWIIPVVTVVVQITILGIGLGRNIDVRLVAALLVGAMLIATGSCLPKLDYIKNYDLSAEKARRINRFLGIETVVMGLLFIISTLFPPVYTVICLFLLIPYTIIGIIYGIKVVKGE